MIPLISDQIFFIPRMETSFLLVIEMTVCVTYKQGNVVVVEGEIHLSAQPHQFLRAALCGPQVP